MTYKTILTCTDGETDGRGRMSAAIALSRRFDAHLSVVALGYEPDLPAYAYGEAPSLAMTQWYEESRKRAETLAEAAAERLEREGARGDAAPLVATYAGAGPAFGARARFSELVVLAGGDGQGGDGAELSEALLEGALFDGDAAVLLAPRELPEKVGSTTLIAWNDSREALRAVRHAMGFLSEAEKIEIVMIDPDEDMAASGEALALMLSRHDLPVELAPLPDEGLGASGALRRRAIEIGADLMVMGAYGRSRFRELILGGVTRDIIRDTPLPVLMAH
ncbi:universal stress protein [Oceanicella actignis]|uniref:universal stress protein n=1 Tax=Oceanicella actignis TaxID=1189325 RepID=UPI0011E83F6D|nr:universal stress protein [Oceanicella actignis]TYO89990.1 universal stress protein family protein [Oceanicella actignis]